MITDCGPLDDVRQSLWLLAGWIAEHGYLPTADSHREVYLGCRPGEPGRGTVEVQAIVTRAARPGYATAPLVPDRLRNQRGRATTLAGCGQSCCWADAPWSAAAPLPTSSGGASGTASGLGTP